MVTRRNERLPGFLERFFFRLELSPRPETIITTFFFATPEKEFSAAFHALIQFKLMCLFYA